MFPGAELETPSVTSMAGAAPCFLIFCQPGFQPCLLFSRIGEGEGREGLTHYTEERRSLRRTMSLSDLRLLGLHSCPDSCVPKRGEYREKPSQNCESWLESRQSSLRTRPHFFPGGTSALACGPHWAPDSAVMAGNPMGRGRGGRGHPVPSVPSMRTSHGKSSHLPLCPSPALPLPTPDLTEPPLAG